MLNKVQIIGRLGADPESVSKGVVRLNVATTEAWKDRESGERREKTEWHKVALFGKLAEVATNYLRKGSLVYIEGSLQTRQYDKDGVTHYSTSIKCRELRMLEKRGDAADEREGEQGRGVARGNGQNQSARAASVTVPRSTSHASGDERGMKGKSAQERESKGQQVEDDDFDMDIPF